jgi:CheY-like chemotaxis protein
LLGRSDGDPLVIYDSQRSPLPNVARGFLRCQRQFSPIPAPGAGTLGLVAAIRWILIVDDDADVRELWSDTLTRGGYRILTARHGRDALALMSAVVPDVIVLDLRMPEMTGSEFLQALRRSPAGRRIPVLIVSGYLEDAAPLSVAGLNVIGRLPKPLSLADLLAALPGASPPQR